MGLWAGLVMTTPWVGLMMTGLVTTALSGISGVSAAAAPRLSAIVGGCTMTPSIEGTRHGARRRSFAAIVHVKLGLAIGQLIFSFQRRARDLMGRSAGGQHSKKGCRKCFVSLLNVLGR